MDLNQLTRKEIRTLKPYVPGKSIEDVQKQWGFQEVTNLSTNESILGTSVSVKKAIIGELEQIYRYPDADCRLLCHDLSDYYGISPEQMIITNGGDELIYLLGQSFISPEDEIIMSQYGFGTYRIISQLFGGKIVSVPFQKNKINLAEMAKKVTKKTKLIFLCNPHNPLGTIITEDDLKQFLKQIPAHPVIVLDEAYLDFVEDKNFPDSVRFIQEDSHHLIALRTFSKIGGIAGLRAGFGLARKELIDILKRVQPPYSVNRIAHVAARAFLSDQHYRKQLLDYNHEGKVFLYQQLNQLNVEYIPTEANFIFVNLKKDAEVICQKLMEQGIIIRSGNVWGCPTFVRITIGLPEQNQVLIKSLTKII